MENNSFSQDFDETENHSNTMDSDVKPMAFHFSDYDSQSIIDLPGTASQKLSSSLVVTAASMAKITLPQKTISNSSTLMQQSSSTPLQQSVSMAQHLLNRTTTTSGANFLIKTNKTNGQQAYVAIPIPQNSQSGTEDCQVMPLNLNSIRSKDHISLTNGGNLMQPRTKSDVEAKSNSIIMQKLNNVQGYSETQSYTSQNSPINMGSGFTYGSGHDNSMYSQTSNMASYMEGSHGVQHNHLYQGYSNQQNHPGSMSVGVSAQAIGVAHQAQYLQPGQSANQRVPISHTTRASPMTVQWLIENYETADGVSLPRSTLYSHYLRHCSESKIDAVNAASFGKLIRSVFLGLKTRRLGTRGNSKYHYYGIRVKPNSPLSRLTDDTQVALRAQPVASKRTIGSTSYDQGSRVEATSSTNNEGMSAASYQQYLGDTSDGLPEVPAIDLTESLPEGISKIDVTSFGNYYRSHCEALLEVISNLQFDLVEALWQAFYRSPAAADKTDNGTLESQDYNISKTMLIVLCKYRPMQEFIKETDYLLYQRLVTLLVPDVLRAVPSTLTQAIRNFAKSLENMLIGSMSEMPKEIVNIKVAAVSAFSQTLRRYTSLNHLAQAARAVLQNPQQISQMWSDLNKVDFNNVQEQSSWVCQCDEALIQKLEEDFKRTLSQQQSLEDWAQWLESVVGMVLVQHQGRDSYPKAARQFLLNWSFYSSMIIRDLTLRSAASFGSFHLIRLLYDEYMFYLIENKVAAHTGKSPLSVMAECVNNSMLHSFNDDDDEGESSNDEGNATPPHVQNRVVNLSEPISQTLIRNDEPPLKRTK